MEFGFEKIFQLAPQISVLVGACLCLALGLVPWPRIRSYAPWAAALSLFVAICLILACNAEFAGHNNYQSTRPTLTLNLALFVNLALAGIGMILLLLVSRLPHDVHPAAEDADPKAFDAGQVIGGEFLAFFLLSLMGAMLVAGTDGRPPGLIWLFLALELTSLPTYVMVALSRSRALAREAAVKYFFLGAMSAAMFLFGFTLMYGATGTTSLLEMAAFVKGHGLSPLLVTGLVLAVVGISFKIAAVPMHFYAPDVYQGAASPVTAFLAFVPKTAGFVALIHLLSVAGWPLPPVLLWTIFIIAALTMTVGNVLGLVQSNVKRVLAYSSIAHSGYMLVGLVAAPAFVLRLGPDSYDDVGQALGDGVAAVLFYLVVYGFATVGAFGVLACLRVRGQEAETFDDISGLSRSNPALAAVMAVSVLSLIGLPPLAGFLGKVYLFGSAFSRLNDNPAILWLVLIALLNSAISAAYYLRIAATCFFGAPASDVRLTEHPSRLTGAILAAVLVVGTGLFGGPLVDAARRASPLPSAPPRSDSYRLTTFPANSAPDTAPATRPSDR